MVKNAQIIRKEGVRGGAPSIAGTRITVTDIVHYYRLYLPEIAARLSGPPDPRKGCMVPIAGIVEEIRTHLPHLSPAQVQAALAYWYGHEDELAQELREEEAASREAEQMYSRLP